MANRPLWAVEVFVLFCLIAYGLIMLGIGGHNLRRGESPGGCPSSQGLPDVLVVGGALLLAGIIFRHMLSLFVDSAVGCCADRDCCSVGGKVLRFGALIVYDTLYICLCLGWDIASAIYVAETIEYTPFNFIKELLGDDFKYWSWKVKQVYGTDILSEVPVTQQDDIWICDRVVYEFVVVSIVSGFVCTVIFFIILVPGKLFCNMFCCKPCREEVEGTTHA